MPPKIASFWEEPSWCHVWVIFQYIFLICLWSPSQAKINCGESSRDKLQTKVVYLILKMLFLQYHLNLASLQSKIGLVLALGSRSKSWMLQEAGGHICQKLESNWKVVCWKMNLGTICFFACNAEALGSNQSKQIKNKFFQQCFWSTHFFVLLCGVPNAPLGFLIHRSAGVPSPEICQKPWPMWWTTGASVGWQARMMLSHWSKNTFAIKSCRNLQCWSWQNTVLTS